MKDKKVIKSSQHRFMRRKSCLANPAASSDEERRADVVYLNFSRAFDTVSDYILIDKLMKYVLDKLTVRCVENCLNCQSQS